jgi:hypothetical protein
MEPERAGRRGSRAYERFHGSGISFLKMMKSKDLDLDLALNFDLDLDLDLRLHGRQPPARFPV